MCFCFILIHLFVTCNIQARLLFVASCFWVLSSTVTHYRFSCYIHNKEDSQLVHSHVSCFPCLQTGEVANLVGGQESFMTGVLGNIKWCNDITVHREGILSSQNHDQKDSCLCCSWILWCHWLSYHLTHDQPQRGTGFGSFASFAFCTIIVTFWNDNDTAGCFCLKCFQQHPWCWPQ